MNREKYEKEYEAMAERKASSELIFDGTVLHVYRDDITLPDGNAGFRELIRHIGAVCIVPVTEKGNIILERQYRYAIDSVITEIPAGKLDYREEDRLEAAKRELREETGYTADCWENLGDFIPAPAYSDERITMYLATGLHKGERDLDDDEFLQVIEMPIEEGVRQVMAGEITDAKTMAGILKAAVKVGKVVSIPSIISRADN